jgi:hypothetical protein
MLNKTSLQILRSLFLGILLLGGIFGTLSVAQAHFIENDGPIGVLLHIDPNDSPGISQPATTVFEISDKQNKFNGADCTCSLTITNVDGFIFSDDFVNDKNGRHDQGVFESRLTFPRIGIYTVQLHGIPHEPGMFSAFTVRYDIRVDAENAPASSASAHHHTNHLWHYLLLGSAPLLGMMALVYDILKPKKTH